MKPDFLNIAEEAVKMLAIHSTWMLLLIFALSKRFQNTFLKRALWRSSFVVLSILILLTFSGVYQWDWFSVVSTRKQPLSATESPVQWKPMTLVEPLSSYIILLSPG
jgi:glucan phosphoethanolaminetransferase (alkaline phosphatase superfamily)